MIDVLKINFIVVFIITYKGFTSMAVSKKILNSLKLQGILLIIFGIAAILLPVISTLTIEIIIASALFVGGIFQVVGAIMNKEEKNFWLNLILGIAYTIAGLFMLLNPFFSAAVLTIMVATLIFMGGIFTTVYALSNRDQKHWGWVLVNGIAGIILAIIVWSGFPFNSFWLLGTLAGVNMVFSGITLLMFVSNVKKREQARAS